jgi:DNA-binding response OmpR family regulator
MQPFVLVIDDEETLVEMLQTALTLLGYRSGAETRLDAGLRRAAQDRPDIILLDNHFPEGHADEIVPALRIALPSTPVVIITANESDVHAQAALRLGACRILGKPFSLADLQAVIATYAASGAADSRVA